MVNGVKFSSLWQSLVDDGYNVGTYEEFIKKLDDSSKVSSLELFLKSEYNLDDQDIERITKMEKMLEEEEVSKTKFPSMFQMGRNLVKDTWTGMKAKSKGYNWMVSAEKANERLEICRQCPFFKYDKENGEGVLIKNKKKFKGFYKNGIIFNGMTRIDVKSSSGVYEGSIKNSRINGYGKLWDRDFMNNYKEKLIYEGIWHNGNPKKEKPVSHFEDLNIFNC